jgi:hypothetical protein
MSYAIGNVSTLRFSRDLNLNLSKATSAANLEKLRLPPTSDGAGDGAGGETDDETGTAGGKKALIVGALVVAGIAVFALNRRR